ncbi:TetR/AcrR family transcriptional regulator [Kitasatospora sp. NPDC057198]|uniref:TetR/AcrR family transcriptional regulator n=1 Tax=Kitasatospora sp. NPDC057198 TaxID=3346046 RepID=UPI003638555A
MTPPGRRTQQQRSEATTADLLAAARRLFAADGYAATSLDTVCEQAGVSRGALYHHFRNKEALFLAVYEREQRALAAAIAEEFGRHLDPWEGLVAGCRVFLVRAHEPAVQRITIIDAPSALGWNAVRAVREDCRHMMRIGVSRAVRAGSIAERQVEALASLLHGALCEGAVAVACAEEPEAALEAVLAELGRLLSALADAR